MPARLIQGEDTLLIKLGGTKEEFAAQLARVKTMSGKRYNANHPEHGKVWEIPDDDASLLKLVHTVEPELPPGLLARVRAARQEQASELVTQLPDDAELLVPWAPLMAPKQRAGVEFMLETAQSKAILADDMGGGKTLQSITVVYEKWLRENGETRFLGRILDIAPAAVLDHWRRELERWLLGIDLSEKHLMQLTNHIEDPDEARAERERLLPEWQAKLHAWGTKMGFAPEKVTIIDAAGKDAAAKRAAQVGAVPEGGWCLVNWEKLQKRVKLAGESAKKKGPLDKVKWYGVIADEAHRAKNHDSQQSKALQRLRAPVQIAATGTPVMNNPGELYALLAWLRPEQYTSFWAFYYSYTEFYKGYQGRDVIIGVKNADDLRFELSDKMVRRTKREIHPDIPEPLEPIVYEPPMGAKQAKIYAEAEKDFWFEIAQAPDISKEQKLEMVAALEDEKISIETVKMMIPNAAARTMRLRQVSTSPAILGGEDVSSKLDEAEQIVLSNGIEQPFVWFAWFKDTVDLLVSRFRALGADARGFHGGNSGRQERADMAAAFQAGEFSIICATIKTGGTGIDLYRAADCGFIEEDWVPGENQQAFDRVDRKGQMFHPQRHILRTPDTVDVGKIAPKLATKQLIVETITGGMG
jgi:SNF2 family DNA or RNA helicase